MVDGHSDLSCADGSCNASGINRFREGHTVVMRSYLFILCPPYSGSTALWKLIATSEAVSVLPAEGQFLPEVRDILRRDPWNADVRLPWERIKAVWHGYWDPRKALLVEKSPPHIIRASEIADHFRPAYFILMVRNPYAHCEGLIRRNGWSATESAKFSVRCLREQARNVEQLENTLCFTYEQLTENPQAISLRIQAFMPEIGELKYTDRFSLRSLDGVAKRPLLNLNRKKINALSMQDLKEINNVLRENDDIMTFWGYSYHDLAMRESMSSLGREIKTRASGHVSKALGILGRIRKRFAGSNSGR
jgi:hypothetical protein